MRILHTADWHAGKRLGRHDRLDDCAAVLDEIVALAEAEAVDLVVVAGDLFDRPSPPLDALRLVLDALRRLARPERPVVAIAGNHDSPELFELLAPWLRPQNIHLVGSIRPPEEGGVLDLEAGGERALVACFPFLREGRAVDFLDHPESWHGAYSEKVSALCGAYVQHLERHGEGAVRLLTAHFLAAGVRLGGGGAPRGERPFHMSETYAARGDELPAGPHYLALGHIHAPQPVPGAPPPAEYAGSPLELDFGEAGEAKRAVLAEAGLGRPASLRSLPLTAGRQLLRARGTWERLSARSDLDDAYLDLTVETRGPDPGLADRARQRFPHLVSVRAEYERTAGDRPLRAGEPWDRLYAGYSEMAHGREPDEALLAAFREVLEEVLGAAP